jgi:hypothetical protein
VNRQSAALTTRRGQHRAVDASGSKQVDVEQLLELRDRVCLGQTRCGNSVIIDYHVDISDTAESLLDAWSTEAS